jgi:hypothetical protein
MTHVIKVITSIETCIFHSSDDTVPDTGYGETVPVMIENHGYAGDSIEERKTTVSIGGYMFTVYDIKSLMKLVETYHKALEVTVDE